MESDAYIDGTSIVSLKVYNCIPSTGDFSFVRRSKACDNCIMQSAELVRTQSTKNDTLDSIVASRVTSGPKINDISNGRIKAVR